MKKLLAVAVMALLCCTGMMAKVNVTGRITCGGKAVKGVHVTDGYKWSTTDAKGYYRLDSDKSNGYVFYVLPRGYEATASRGFLPNFWAPLTAGKNKLERHDFKLKKVNNDNCKLIVATDLHLAARNNDVAQCEEMFFKRVNDVVAGSKEKVYSLFLGDVVYDEFWYCNNFGFKEYLDVLERNKYPTLAYHVMGNHDHDAAVPASEQCDFLSSASYRDAVGPRYYSFNLGKAHIIVLDDIFYKNKPTNEKQNKGVAGDQSYDDKFTAEQLAWVKEDLARVADKSAPVFVAVHCNVWRLSTDGKYEFHPYLVDGSADELGKLFAGFSKVEVVSGHMHYNFHIHPVEYPNIHENNIAAACATWWYTRKYSPRHLCRDGSPAGFELYDISGKDISFKFTSIDPVDGTDDPQMRVYDMNTVSEFYRTSPEIKKLAEYYPTQAMYGDVPANQIMLNVFDYDTDWKVEVIENGKPLKVERVVTVDPLHVLCSSVQIIKKDNRKPGICRAINTTHMFVAQAATATAPVEVRVTDSFGRVHTQQLVRPKAYTMEMK